MDQAIEGNASKTTKSSIRLYCRADSQASERPHHCFHLLSEGQKSAKDFKLKFMSELAYATSLASRSDGGPEASVRQLEKFLKEDKYSEFKDQIYFSLGETVYPIDEARAKEYFMKKLCRQ